MKHKILISVLLIFIMLTVQYCENSIINGIITWALIILALLFGDVNAAEEGVHVEPSVPHAVQDGVVNCTAACVEMIAEWDGWNVPGTVCQGDIMNWADDPQNGGDNDGILNVLEIENAVKHFAYDTCFHQTFPTNSGYDYSIDRALCQSMLQIGNNNVPNIMTVDWVGDYNASHAILIQGYDGDDLPGDVANIQKASINDPRETYRDDSYSIDQLRDRMKNFWWNAPGGRYCLGYFLYPVDTETSDAIYYEFLRNCGTYYGGPTIYMPDGTSYLRVRSPNGDNTLAKRKNDQIVWESMGLSGNIRLELYQNTNLLGAIAENLPIGNGAYTWTVGDYSTGSVTTGEKYMIKISMMDDSHEDSSNTWFSIGDINVTIPNGGETWEQGSLRTLTWANSYFTGNVQLLLVKTIPGTDYLIADNIENTGSYEWQVGMCSHIDEPEAPLGMTLPADCYKIKVVSVDNPDLQDSGDQLFSIVEPQPGITVVSPNGGENWQAGSIGNITWNASRLSENVKITLWQNGAVAGTIATPVDPDLGAYSWTVGQHTSGTAQVGNGYTIKIKEIGTAIADFSDASFTIKGIKVTSPDGGENWQVGSTQNITWAAPGVAGDLKITLWQNGVLAGTIVAIISPVLGSYSWTVGQHSGGAAAAGSGYSIKIKERDTAISDTGDASFSLSN